MTHDAPSDGPLLPSEGVGAAPIGRIPIMSAYRASTSRLALPAWTCSPFAGLVPPESGGRLTRCTSEWRYIARSDVQGGPAGRREDGAGTGW